MSYLWVEARVGGYVEVDDKIGYFADQALDRVVAKYQQVGFRVSKEHFLVRGKVLDRLPEGETVLRIR